MISRNKIIIAIVSIVVGVVMIRHLFHVHSVTAELIAIRWRREIQIEDFNPRQESQWCPAPPDAYNVNIQRQVKGYRQVPMGQICTGVKVKTCSINYITVADYADRCYYTVDRWYYKRSVLAAGDDNRAVDWPLVILNPEGACYGCEREGRRIEIYQFVLQDVNGDSVWTCDLPYSFWSDSRIGNHYLMSVRQLGNRPSCDLQLVAQHDE